MNRMFGEWITPKQAAETKINNQIRMVSLKIKTCFSSRKFDEMNEAIMEKMTLQLIDRAKRNKRHLNHFRQKVKISKSHGDKTLRVCGVLYDIKTASELLQRWELKTKEIKK